MGCSHLLGEKPGADAPRLAGNGQEPGADAPRLAGNGAAPAGANGPGYPPGRNRKLGAGNAGLTPQVGAFLLSELGRKFT